MKPSLPIYLDNHATTRVDPGVVDGMLPWFGTDYGNAASGQHVFGWKASAAVRKARKQLASLLHSSEEEIVFTSGATESINLALKGVAAAFGDRPRHIVTAATEHKAALESCASLERMGVRVTRLVVDSNGTVSTEELASVLGPDTILVSVMAANNEIGTIAPVAEIGRICRERRILFHTDAAQAVGKIPIDVQMLNADLMSFTSHKMYGPKGTGALFIRTRSPRIPLAAQIEGGGHEHGFRSGTLNVPGIVGFGIAAEIAAEGLDEEMQRTGRLRDRLTEGILQRCPGTAVNAAGADRLPGNASLRFDGIRADDLMRAVPEIAVSTGSACSSANPRASHVLKAIGLTDDEAHATVRFGIGRFTTEDEIDFAVERVAEAVGTLRTSSLTHQSVHV